MSRPLRQLGAVVIAAALIIVAIVVRHRIDGDAPSAGSTDAPLHLLCDPLFRAACEGVAGATVSVEEPSVTAARLGAESLGADGWVTSDLWSSIAASRHPELAWLAEDKTSVLGTANPILVGQTTKVDALTAACSGTFTWRCVGDHAGQQFKELKSGLTGKVEIGYPPSTSTTGLATVTAIVSSYLGATDFASNDLDEPAFQDWFAKVKAATVDHGSPNQTPLQSFLVIRANYGVVGDLSTSKPDIASVVDASSITATDSTPPIRIRAVIVSPGQRDLPADRLREELAPTWNAEVSAGSLPSGGVLDALSRL